MQKLKNEEQSRYLTSADVAKRIRRSVGTLANDRLNRKGLPFIKFGSRVLYDAEDVEAYMERHKVRFEPSTR